MTYLDENDRRSNGHETIKLAENLVLLQLVRAIHVHLRDTLNRELGLLELHLIGVGRKFLGIRHDLVGECRGEKKDLDCLREQAISRISISWRQKITVELTS